MINLMRKNQRVLMLVIAVVTIIAFVFLYNTTDLEKLGKNVAGTIYGKPINGNEFGRMGRQYGVAQQLGLYELLQLLVGGGRESADDYVWNTFVLRNEAKKLQIEPTSEAVSARIQQLTPFQTNGHFDIDKYNGFVVNVLTPNGFTQTQLEDVVRDDLRRSKLHDLIGASSVVTENEVREAYGEAFRQRHLQVVKLKREDMEAGVKVSPEEIKAEYEKNKQRYQTAEKRAVQYVVFGLNDEQKKLTGKEKIAALQPISNQADEFSQQLVKAGANFDAIAKEIGVEIKTTIPFVEASAPTELAAVPQLGATAFSLTKETPDSDVLQTEDSFYILHLSKVEPAVQETLEAATPQITAQLRNEKIAAAMTKRAVDARKELQTAMKTGKTFAQAAEAAGLKVETLPPYAAADQQQSQMGAERLIQLQAALLGEGMLSELIPTGDGGAIAYLEKLDPLDEEKWKSEKENVMDRFATGKQEMAFQEWFRAQRAAANIRIGRAQG